MWTITYIKENKYQLKIKQTKNERLNGVLENILAIERSSGRGFRPLHMDIYVLPTRVFFLLSLLSSWRSMLNRMMFSFGWWWINRILIVCINFLFVSHKRSHQFFRIRNIYCCLFSFAECFCDSCVVALQHAFIQKWKLAGHKARYTDNRWSEKVTICEGPTRKKRRGRLKTGGQNT